MATAAPACVAALAEATKLWPTRNTAADGILSSRKHQQVYGTSDHDLGNAFDLTHDPNDGVDCNLLSAMLRARVDPRVKYIIWNRRIWNPSISPDWRVYDGDNPHTAHMHVSIYASQRDNLGLWWVLSTGVIIMPDDPNLPNISGPIQVQFCINQDGVCQGYYYVSLRTGELHAWGPGAVYYGRSEVIT